MRRRGGQIVFLEFAATLPIFMMLMIASRWFHSYYQRTLHAYAQARLGVDVRLDEHHSKRKVPDLYELYANDGRRRRDDALARLDPAVRHLKVNEFDLALTALLQALADPTRLGVVQVLSTGPRRAGELAEVAGLSAPAMSKEAVARITNSSGVYINAIQRGKTSSAMLAPAMNVAPRKMAVLPALLAPAGSLRPMAWPTRTAAAEAIPSGTMYVKATVFKAI